MQKLHPFNCIEIFDNTSTSCFNCGYCLRYTECNEKEQSNRFLLPRITIYTCSQECIYQGDDFRAKILVSNIFNPKNFVNENFLLYLSTISINGTVNLFKVFIILNTNFYSLNFVIFRRLVSQRNKIGCKSIININVKRDKYIFPDVFIALCVKKSQYRETA